MSRDGILPKIADVVVVGGGIVGLSIAYHLGLLGVRALVLERNRVGEGSTARSSGGIRRLFSTEPALRLAVESVRFWERFEEHTGARLDWHRVGYLLIARSEANRRLLEASRQLQRKWGVPSSLLTNTAVGQLVPAMRSDDILGGLYCATDGYAGPYEALRAFRATAVELGAAILEECEVTGFRLIDGRIDGVDTSKGVVCTPIVVNAAGVWAPGLARQVGVDIETVMLRRHQWIIQTSEPHEPVPCTIDMESTLFVRPEGSRYLLGIGGEQPTTTFETAVDPDAFVPVAGLAIERFPIFASATLVRSWAGLTQETPDRHPVLGPAGPAGHLVATGFSHGFMHAPAAGKVMAEYITSGRSATIPLEPFSASRFSGLRADAKAPLTREWEAH